MVVALGRPQQVLAFKWPTFLPLLVLAPFVGFACIALEYLVGVLILYLRTKKLVTRVTVHSSYSVFSRIDGKDILSVLVVVVGEELILRQLLYSLLATDLAIAVWLVILLCAVAYAINHLSFGAASAISKFPSGLALRVPILRVGLVRRGRDRGPRHSESDSARPIKTELMVIKPEIVVMNSGVVVGQQEIARSG